MRTQFLVGEVGDVACAIVQLGDVGYGDVAQVLGRAIEVARCVVGQRLGKYGKKR